MHYLYYKDESIYYLTQIFTEYRCINKKYKNVLSRQNAQYFNITAVSTHNCHCALKCQYSSVVTTHFLRDIVLAFVNCADL
jgi:hypothetical protein